MEDKEYEILLFANPKSDSKGFITRLANDYRPLGFSRTLPKGSFIYYNDKPSSIFGEPNPMHIYVVTKGTIEKGDYFVELSENGVRESYANKVYYCDIGTTNCFVLTREINFPFPDNCRVIAASTDGSLKGVPRISIDFIDRYLISLNSGNRIDKVMNIQDVLKSSLLTQLKNTISGNR